MRSLTHTRDKLQLHRSTSYSFCLHGTPGLRDGRKVTLSRLDYFRSPGNVAEYVRLTMRNAGPNYGESWKCWTYSVHHFKNHKADYYKVCLQLQYFQLRSIQINSAPHLLLQRASRVDGQLHGALVVSLLHIRRLSWRRTRMHSSSAFHRLMSSSGGAVGTRVQHGQNARHRGLDVAELIAKVLRVEHGSTWFNMVERGRAICIWVP